MAYRGITINKNHSNSKLESISRCS